MFNFKFKSSITDFLIKQIYKYIKRIYFNIREDKQNMQRSAPWFDIATSRRKCENFQRTSCKSAGPAFLPNRKMWQKIDLSTWSKQIKPVVKSRATCTTGGKAQKLRNKGDAPRLVKLRGHSSLRTCTRGQGDEFWIIL